MVSNSLGSSLQKGGENLKERVSRMAKLAIIPLFLMVAPILKGQGVGINPTGAAPDANAMLDVAGGPTYVDDLRIRNIFSNANGAFLRTDINGDVSRTNFSGLATQYLDGTGNFSTPLGTSKWTLSGTMLSPNNLADNVNIGKPTPTNVNKLSVVGGGMAIGNDGYTNIAAPIDGLHVQGPIRTGTNAAGTSQLDARILAGDALTNLFNLQKGGTNYLRVGNNGFISAGTTTAGQRFTLHSGTIGNVNIRQQYDPADNYSDIIYSPSYHRYLDIKTLGPQPASTYLHVNADDDLHSYGKDAHLNNTIVSPDRAGHYFLTTIPENIGMVVNFDTGIASSTTPKPAFQVFANTADGPTAVAADINNGDIHLTTTDPFRGRVFINGVSQGKRLPDAAADYLPANVFPEDRYRNTTLGKWRRYDPDGVWRDDL